MKTAIVLACDDNFIPYASVVARHIANYATEKFPIFVLSDDISEENKKISRIYCPRIEFIEAVDRFPIERLPTGLHFSRATYMRLFLDEILDVDKVVYIDSDASILTDISPLLALRLQSAPIAAAYDLQELCYGANEFPLFNGGVAVYDMKAIRSEGLFKAAIRFALENPEKCKLVDQDALNHVLEGRWQVLDWRWNLHGFMSADAPQEPFIRHFTGPLKPWGPTKLGIERRYINQWRSDLAASPWKGRFVEQKWHPRLFFRPISKAIEDRIRKTVHSEASGRRGDKARFMLNFRSILTDIQEASLEGLAARSHRPEPLKKMFHSG